MKSNLREQNIEKRQKLILASAREIILSQGPGELSMRTLAKTSGLSVTTLYNLFGSKDEIITALGVEAIEAIRPHLLAQSNNDPFAAVQSMIVTPVNYLLENAELFRSIIAVGYYDTPMRMAEYKQFLYGNLIKTISQFLEAAQKQKFFNDQISMKLVAAEIFYTYRLALEDWACGEIENDALKRRVQSGVLCTLLAISTLKSRTILQNELDIIQDQTIKDLEKRFSAFKKRVTHDEFH